MLSISAIISHFFTSSPALKFTFVIVPAILKLKLCSSTSSTFQTTSILSFMLPLETTNIFSIIQAEVLSSLKKYL
ncbi:MAG: hypothetical protein LBQ59_05560 [Candidatus Peribacteria bacterium]|nr:hypothetical protein [Candidatus Peribacteria bacterium]